MEPRARVSVWPGRRRVPGIVAPDSWGARGAECLPCDVPRRSSPATSSRDGTTARRCLCHGTGSGTTEARPPPPPASSVPPAPHGVWGVVAPRGQSRAGFSEQQFIILILARKDEPTPDYPRAPTLAATPQQQQRRARKTRMNLFQIPPRYPQSRRPPSCGIQHIVFKPSIVSPYQHLLGAVRGRGT